MFIPNEAEVRQNVVSHISYHAYVVVVAIVVNILDKFAIFSNVLVLHWILSVYELDPTSGNHVCIS